MCCAILMQIFLWLSVSQAFLLNMCIFWCTTANSPLATTVTGLTLCVHCPRLTVCACCEALLRPLSAAQTGQMKDILTTGLGMFIFGDVKFNAKNLVGVAIGLMGGILYSYFSYKDSQQKAAREAVRTSAATMEC